VPNYLLPLTNPHPAEKTFIEINRVGQSEAELYFPLSFFSSLLLGTFPDFFPGDLKALLLITGAARGTAATATYESSWITLLFPFPVPAAALRQRSCQENTLT